MKLEYLFKKVAPFIFLHYQHIVIAFSLLIIISLYTIFNMNIESDILDVLPTNNKTVAQYKDFIEKYGAMDNIVFMIETDNNRIEEYGDLIENLAKKLIESPCIEYVDHSPLTFINELFLRRLPLFLDENGLMLLKKRLTPLGIKQQVKQNRQKLHSPLSSPFDVELISRDPLNLSEIFRDSLMNANKTNSFDFSMGYYFTRDHSAALVFAKPKGKSKDMAFVKKLKKDLDAIVSSVIEENGKPPGIKIGLTGGYILSDDVRQIIKHDIVSSFTLSIIFIALIIWIAYRVKTKILLAIGLTMLAALAMTLAFAYFIFGSLNIVTSVVASVLIGLYVDYSLHTVKRYCDELKRHNNPQMALEITLMKTGPAITLSAITTSLSFFCILVTKFQGLYELGVVSGIGVIICLISNVFLMNSLLVWISKSGLQNIQYGKEYLYGVGNLAKLLTGKPGYILIISIVFVGLSGVGVYKLKFNNNPDSLAPRNSSAILLGKKLSEKIGKKGEPLNIIIKAKGKEELMLAFDNLEKVVSRWKHEGFIEDYNSLNMFMPAPSIQLIRINELKKIGCNSVSKADILENTFISTLEKNNFVYEENYIKKYLHETITTLENIELMSLGELETMSMPNIRHFYNKDDISIATYLYPTGKGWDKQTIDAIRKDIISKGENWILVGKPILFNEIQSSVIWDSGLATALTVILNLVVLYGHFKRILTVMLVMLPVTLGFIFTLGIMGWLHIPFNVFNIGSIALIFGLGVDYGIYIMQAYLMEDKKDIRNALRISGKNVIMCAATTVAGCGSLVTAKFVGIATIGLVLSIGAITCAFTALVILPAIVHRNEKRFCHDRF